MCNNDRIVFQKDLIVWKPVMCGTMAVIASGFQKDLIVWKHCIDVYDKDYIGVSEGLNSVETPMKKSRDIWI